MSCEAYSEMYWQQFFSTLGQLSAVCVSSAFVVPMWNYYKLNGTSVWSRLQHTLYTEWDSLSNTESVSDTDFENAENEFENSKKNV